jgi:hypothetical protein
MSFFLFRLGHPTLRQAISVICLFFATKHLSKSNQSESLPAHFISIKKEASLFLSFISYQSIVMRIKKPVKYLILILHSLLFAVSCQINQESHHDHKNKNSIDTFTLAWEEPRLSECADFYYSSEAEIILALISDNEYVYVRDEVAYRGNYVTKGKQVWIFDDRDMQWGVFDLLKMELYIEYYDSVYKLLEASSFGMHEKTVVLRLLCKNPYLTWYDSNLHYTLAAINDNILYATQTEPVMEYIATTRNKRLDKSFRNQWWEAWECALHTEPEFLLSWLAEFRVDMMAKYLYIGSSVAGRELNLQIQAKLNELQKRFPDCLMKLKEFLNKE